MRTNRVFSAISAVAALTLVSLPGCSDGRPRRVPVSGTVVIDGEPLPLGNIRFVPESGRPSVARVGSDGRFTLRCFEEGDGAIVGTHQVSISAKKLLGGNNVEKFAPTHYANHKTSGITVEITEPVDDLVIELTWAGEKRGRKPRE